MLLSVMIGGCKKKDNTRPLIINGKCFVNGVQKNVQVSILTRVGEQKSEFSARMDHLTGIYSINPIIASANGVYPVSNITEYSQQEPSYPDYPCETYELVITDVNNNYTEITKYNPDKKEMSGRFGFTFMKVRSNCDRIMPDTIRVTNGTFENVVIYDQNK